MPRSNARAGARLIYSVRTPADIMYAPELSERIDASALSAAFCYTREAPEIFVYGPGGFVEAVASLLVEAGHEPEDIRTERFG